MANKKPNEEKAAEIVAGTIREGLTLRNSGERPARRKPCGGPRRYLLRTAQDR
jgi:hypothetical protein